MNSVFEINRHLFAAYCGMVKSGYDLMDRADPLVSSICTELDFIDFGNEIPEYFSYTRTDMVEVNPYYPRGSILSSVCFFLDKKREEFIRFLQLCESPEAEDCVLFEWLDRLPAVLKQIETHEKFENLFLSIVLV